MHNIPALHKHEAVGHVRGGSLYNQEDSGGTMLGQGIRTDVWRLRAMQQHTLKGGRGSLNDVSGNRQFPNCAPADQGDPFRDWCDSLHELLLGSLTCSLTAGVHLPAALVTMLWYLSGDSVMGGGWEREWERGNPCCNNNLRSSLRTSTFSTVFIWAEWVAHSPPPRKKKKKTNASIPELSRQWKSIPGFIFWGGFQEHHTMKEK